MSWRPKLERLEEILADAGRCAVAFSGGADSAFASEVGHRVLGADCIAVTADSLSLKRSELDDAKALARARGWSHEVVRTAELDDERYAANPSNRCYWCKTALMQSLMPYAKKGLAIMLGTNVDDLGDHRPGQQAATQMGARHPLVEAGFTKAEVRQASLALGLPTHDKPAQACLSSRIAYGVRVTPAALGRVERAEHLLIGMGFEVVRVRDLGADRCSVEVEHSRVPVAIGRSAEIQEAMGSAGFASVVIDERGYRMGSMNELLSIGRGRDGA